MKNDIHNKKGERHNKIYATERAAKTAIRSTISKCQEMLGWGLEHTSYYNDKIAFFQTLEPVKVDI